MHGHPKKTKQKKTAHLRIIYLPNQKSKSASRYECSRFQDESFFSFLFFLTLDALITWVWGLMVALRPKRMQKYHAGLCEMYAFSRVIRCVVELEPDFIEHMLVHLID